MIVGAGLGFVPPLQRKARCLHASDSYSTAELRRHLDSLGVSSLGERAELERRLFNESPVGWSGFKSIADRGRELRQTMDLSEDELRAILIGRGLDADSLDQEDRVSMARTLADIRVAERRGQQGDDLSSSSSRGQRRQRSALGGLGPLSPPPTTRLSYDVVDTLLNDVPKVAIQTANGVFNGVSKLVDTAEKHLMEEKRGGSSSWRELAANGTNFLADFSRGCLGSASTFADRATTAASTAARAVHTTRTRPWVLNAALAVADWASGPYLRREVVLVAAVVAPLATRTGLFGAVLTLFSFRLLRDAFAKLDTFLASRENIQGLHDAHRQRQHHVPPAAANTAPGP